MGRYELDDQQKLLALIIAVVVFLIIVAAGIWLFTENIDGPDLDQQVLDIPVLDQQSTPDSARGTASAELEAGIALSRQAIDDAALSGTHGSDQQDSIEAEPLPSLNDSDAVFKTEVVGISAELAQWLGADQLIKKYLVIVNDFSQGLRPYKHFRFIKQAKPFSVSKDGQGLYIANKSYQRYDSLAAAIGAMDADASIALFKRFQPLLQQVFVEFGYPEEYQLEDIFKKAASNIIQAPVIKGRVGIIRPTVYYKFADKKLESLDPVQKQMIRMGPDNTLIIQNKLRKMLEALGQSEE